jgi:hypothetical protein
MGNQPQQRFCINCGQPLAPDAAFCVVCGTQMSAAPTGVPGRFSAGAQPGYPPPYAQAPTQAQDDPLLGGLAAGYVASRMGRQPLLRARRRPRRPGSRLRGCGCLLLILALLAGPFIGVALTSGRPHLIFTYVAGGMVIFFFLLLLIGMLATRRGREALSEGSAEGCLEAIRQGLLGGG